MVFILALSVILMIIRADQGVTFHLSGVGELPTFTGHGHILGGRMWVSAQFFYFLLWLIRMNKNTRPLLRPCDIFSIHLFDFFFIDILPAFFGFIDTRQKRVDKGLICKMDFSMYNIDDWKTHRVRFAYFVLVLWQQHWNSMIAAYGSCDAWGSNVAYDVRSP